jgi:hypothetical protein
MTGPLILKRHDLALKTVDVLLRFWRGTDKGLRPHLLVVAEGRKTRYQVHYSDFEHGAVVAILRLLLSGYSSEAITPIMVSHERESPRFGANPE